MKLLITLSMALLFSFSAYGQQIDQNASQFKWKADKKVGEGHWGSISLKSAKAKFEKGKIKSAEFVMDLNSFTVDNLNGEWESKFITHVKGDDFFDVAKFPTAKLTIEKQVGDNQVTGNLTIKGKSKPVKIKFTKSKNTYTGKLVFDRTQYGIIYGAGNFFKELTADKIIKDNVEIDFKVVLKK